jgi:hypothetical protein
MLSSHLPSVKDTYFQHFVLTKIHGGKQLMYDTLRLLADEVKANAASVPTTLGGGVIIEITLLYCISTPVLKLQLMPLESHPCVTPNHSKYSCPGS